MHLYVEYHTR